MKFFQALAIGIISINMTACGILIPMSQGEHVELSELDKVEICKTTKAEVVQLVGEPTQRGTQSGYTTMNWMYSRVFLFNGEFQRVVAFFNKKGVLVDYSVNPVGLVEINDQCE